MKAVLAGGGTGGHVIPALAIAQELRSLYNADVMFIGTARGIETKLVPKAGFPLALIEIGALNRVSMGTRMKTAVLLPKSIFTSAKLLRNFHADVVVGVGGYASGPAMLASALTGIPSLIFEPNLVPGFANRMAAMTASAAAVQFQKTCQYFRRCTVTGVPVRKAFFEIPPRPRGSEPTLLVFGGSQGARAINDNMVHAATLLQRQVPGLRIIHQTGERDYNDAQRSYTERGINAEVSPFIDDMPGAFSRADLLLCRSGASTVAEITAAGKPAIFVPLPTAADDHQTHNAQALVDAGAAVLLRQSEMTGERLAQTIVDLAKDPQSVARMSEAARKLAHPNAALDIAEMAGKLAGIAMPTAAH